MTLRFLTATAAALLLAGCQTLTTQAPAPSREASEAPASSPAASHPEARSYPAPRGYPEPRGYPAPAPASPPVSAVIAEHEQRAAALVAEARWQEAIEVAERGLRLDRRHASFYRLLGESYLGLGDRSAAERFARQAQRFCGRDCHATEALIETLGQP